MCLPRSVCVSYCLCVALFVAATAMPSPASSSGDGARVKARYLSPTMAAIRMQRENMTKTLKVLRKDMRKEPSTKV